MIWAANAAIKIGAAQAHRKLFLILQREKEKLKAERFTPRPKLLAQRLVVKEGEQAHDGGKLGGCPASPSVDGEDGSIRQQP